MTPEVKKLLVKQERDKRELCHKIAMYRYRLSPRPSQAQVAKVLGISQPTLARIELQIHLRNITPQMLKAHYRKLQKAYPKQG